MFFSLLYIILGFCGEAVGLINLYTYDNGILNDGVSKVEKIPWELILLRALYFSVVTMTTLGFGDIYVSPTCFLTHFLVILQVLIGYILLAAIMTRFAIFFTTPMGIQKKKIRGPNAWDDLCEALNYDISGIIKMLNKSTDKNKER